ncbi:MAG: hypothetical protein M3O93_08900, partial [Chloroflexota bacterium]|nr:hypothetical protein [Chloroflexota bacterium]
MLWGFYAGALLAGTLFDPGQTFGSLALGAIPFVAGVGLGLRGDPPPTTPAIDAPAGQPGSRVIGSIAAAIRQPTLIGPFGQPHIAMLVAVVLAFLIVPLLIPGDVPIVARAAIVALVAALVGTEAFVRFFPDRSRRAFEAFSWLGEWELARARAIAGGSIPTSTSAAEAWLRDRPEREEEMPLRIEVLVFAGRIEEARSLVPNLPTGTPTLDFERAALADLVDFRGGADGDREAMERAATMILPEDGDDRLRAEVSVAVAHVRRRMADPATETADAIEPLLEVRRCLGHRADGQVGRAFRRR